MRISDWSSDVCSSDLIGDLAVGQPHEAPIVRPCVVEQAHDQLRLGIETALVDLANADARILGTRRDDALDDRRETLADRDVIVQKTFYRLIAAARSVEHTSEIQSLMRTSYAVFCLK